MFGISMWEMALIILVGLIFLGPRQLTETARVVGRLFREIQRMAIDVKDSIDLDAPIPKKKHEPPAAPPTPEPDTTEKTLNKDSLNLTGEKSGPDFYAELLENAVEDDSKTPDKKVETIPEAKLKTLDESVEKAEAEKKTSKT
ncbi:MAG: twin-arginine translocase TatA/TatE family subunit [Desulfomonilaceae bacterium]